jgi:hypothetical protein
MQSCKNRLRFIHISTFAGGEGEVLIIPKKYLSLLLHTAGLVSLHSVGVFAQASVG